MGERGHEHFPPRRYEREICDVKGSRSRAHRNRVASADRGGELTLESSNFVPLDQVARAEHLDDISDRPFVQRDLGNREFLQDLSLALNESGLRAGRCACRWLWSSSRTLKTLMESSIELVAGTAPWMPFRNS